MDVYLFLSGSTWNVSAFTADQSGANLPAEYAPWTPANGGRVMLAGAEDPVSRAVSKDGFFLLGGRHGPHRPRCSAGSGRSILTKQYGDPAPRYDRTRDACVEALGTSGAG